MLAFSSNSILAGGQGKTLRMAYPVVDYSFPVLRQIKQILHLDLDSDTEVSAQCLSDLGVPLVGGCCRDDSPQISLRYICRFGKVMPGFPHRQFAFQNHGP
jgi:hypothetical protein